MLLWWPEVPQNHIFVTFVFSRVTCLLMAMGLLPTLGFCRWATFSCTENLLWLGLSCVNRIHHFNGCCPDDPGLVDLIFCFFSAAVFVFLQAKCPSCDLANGVRALMDVGIWPLKSSLLILYTKSGMVFQHAPPFNHSVKKSIANSPECTSFSPLGKLAETAVYFANVFSLFFLYF